MVEDTCRPGASVAATPAEYRPPPWRARKALARGNDDTSDSLNVEGLDQCADIVMALVPGDRPRTSQPKFTPRSVLFSGRARVPCTTPAERSGPAQRPSVRR